MAPSTSGAAQWAINRRGDVVRLGCVGRVGPTSPLTGATWLLNRPKGMWGDAPRPSLHCTNVRNVKSRHWRSCLGIENRCRCHSGTFPRTNTCPTARDHRCGLPWTRRGRSTFFAGIWTRWTCVRKVKEGETTKRPLRVSDDRCKPGGRVPCRFFMCGWEKAPQKAGPQYILHEGVPAKGSPS